MSKGTRLVLASASPRRAELLRALGLEFEVRPVELDEIPLAGESPPDHANRLAVAKATTYSHGDDSSLVIGCDTVVVVGSEILGKPRAADDARRMLELLSGRRHEVISAVAICGRETVSGYSKTYVTFAPLSEKEIDWYVASGEPMDKAGAYGIQGYAALFVSEISGSYSSVVGLPLELLPELFGKLGIDLFSLIRPSDSYAT